MRSFGTAAARSISSRRSPSRRSSSPASTNGFRRERSPSSTAASPGARGTTSGSGSGSGEIRLVVGARSALFAPVRNLRLIIVDEEHDPSYKQDDRLRYNARDLALVRGKFARATVILGSATPGIQTYFHAPRRRYRHLTLPSRVDDRPLPRVEVVDHENGTGRTGPDAAPLPCAHRGAPGDPGQREADASCFSTGAGSIPSSSVRTAATSSPARPATWRSRTTPPSGF